MDTWYIENEMLKLALEIFVPVGEVSGFHSTPHDKTAYQR